ncbi:YcaO-like family protein [Rhizobium sp. TRM95111]|nr:YcaO-like family protein [Rhizobium alarense]
MRAFLPRYGITRLARLTSLDRVGIPVWNAVAPNALSIVINQGKGISDAAARTSAAMEALERAIAGRPTVAMRITSRRHLMVEGLATETLDGLIAARASDIAEDDVLAWAEGFELLENRPIFVPLEAAMLDRTRDGMRFWQSSDGLASGNTPQEAILHGLLERIERDAEALWHFRPRKTRHRRCVDPASFGDPVLSDLVKRIDEADLQLRLFDITSDVAVPSYLALLAEGAALRGRAARYLDVTNGSGTHPAAVRAAIRAVTEAAQSRLTHISGARDDIDPRLFAAPLPDALRAEFDAVPAVTDPQQSHEDPGLEQMLHATLGCLRAARIGCVIAVPLSEPDLPFAVAKVFVPGLESPSGERKRRYGARAISMALVPS